jgi:hypothetical protein
MLEPTQYIKHTSTEHIESVSVTSYLDHYQQENNQNEKGNAF